MTKPAIEGGCPEREAFLPFACPVLGDAEIDEVADAMRSGWLATGPRTERLEEAFAAQVGNRYAVGTTSGTAALALALEVAGVGPGDEVITTPLTFAATAHQILLRGAVPVPVDIDRRTLNIDPNLVDAAVTPRTKALLPVHFAGRPCAMDALQDVAQQHDLKIVSDSAHAVEATYQDRKLAAWSDVSAYSFHPNKNMTTGEGGMVTTDHEGWAAEARLLRFHGIDKSGRPGGDIVRLGYKFNMSDLQAAIGLHQLQRLDEHYAVRREVFDIYQQAFDSSAHITPPAGFDDANRHALHMYNILLDVDGLSVTRDQFLEALSAENIGCGVHYTSLHRMTYYRERFDWPDERFPESSFVSDRILTLPLHAGMDDEDARDVTRAIRKLVDHYAKAS